MRWMADATGQIGLRMAVRLTALTVTLASLSRQEAQAEVILDIEFVRSHKRHSS